MNKIYIYEFYRHKLEKNSLFDLNGRKEELTNGLCYIIGQYLSIKPCQYGWLQNSDSMYFDIKITKFYTF